MEKNERQESLLKEYKKLYDILKTKYDILKTKYSEDTIKNIKDTIELLEKNVIGDEDLEKLETCSEEVESLLRELDIDLDKPDDELIDEEAMMSQEKKEELINKLNKVLSDGLSDEKLIRQVNNNIHILTSMDVPANLEANINELYNKCVESIKKTSSNLSNLEKYVKKYMEERAIVDKITIEELYSFMDSFMEKFDLPQAVDKASKFVYDILEKYGIKNLDKMVITKVIVDTNNIYRKAIEEKKSEILLDAIHKENLVTKFAQIKNACCTDKNGMQVFEDYKLELLDLLTKEFLKLDSLSLEDQRYGLSILAQVRQISSKLYNIIIKGMFSDVFHSLFGADATKESIYQAVPSDDIFNISDDEYIDEDIDDDEFTDDDEYTDDDDEYIDDDDEYIDDEEDFYDEEDEEEFEFDRLGTFVEKRNRLNLAVAAVSTLSVVGFSIFAVNPITIAAGLVGGLGSAVYATVFTSSVASIYSLVKDKHFIKNIKKTVKEVAKKVKKK